jgi:hypothetical protein
MSRPFAFLAHMVLEVPSPRPWARQVGACNIRSAGAAFAHPAAPVLAAWAFIAPPFGVDFT